MIVYLFNGKEIDEPTIAKKRLASDDKKHLLLHGLKNGEDMGECGNDSFSKWSF